MSVGVTLGDLRAPCGAMRAGCEGVASPPRLAVLQARLVLDKTFRSKLTISWVSMNTWDGSEADRRRPSNLAPPFKAEFDLDCTETQYNPYSKLHKESPPAERWD